MEVIKFEEEEAESESELDLKGRGVGSAVEDGDVGDERAFGVHQRHPQLPEQGSGEAPRRQGARQHPNPLQKRKG